MPVEVVREPRDDAELVDADVRQHHAAVGEMVEVALGVPGPTFAKHERGAEATVEEKLKSGAEVRGGVEEGVGIHAAAAVLKVDAEAAEVVGSVVVAEEERSADDDRRRAVDDRHRVEFHDTL